MQAVVEPLQRKLGATRRWWRATRLLSGLTWVVSVVILLALVCYHWDSRWTLNTQGREIWRLVIFGGGGATLLVGMLRALLHRLTDMRLAADVERRYPVLRERLLTTLDLAPALGSVGGASSAPYASSFSETLASSVADETQRVASDLDFRRAVSLRPLRSGLLTMLCMLALLTLHILFAGPAFANWLRRMASPHSDIAPYAHTRLQVLPSASLLPAGEGAWVTVKTWGDPADHGTLYLRHEGEGKNEWDPIPLTNPVHLRDPGTSSEERNPRSFRVRLNHLSNSVTLYASANDGRSNEREIRVAARPTILNVRLRVRYPAYMHRVEKTIDAPNGSIAAPVGSEVDVTATANNPLRSVDFLHNDIPGGKWRVNGRETSGHLAISRDGSYGLKLTDTNRFENLEALRYAIHAEKDQTPTVQINRPAADIDLVPGGSLPLIAHAVDDYGVVSMKLAWTKVREDISKVGEARVARAGGGDFALPGPDGGPQALVQQRWHIDSVAPRPGDTIQYEVDALDNDTLDGPHLGRSLLYRVHVVSLPDMQARLKVQLDEEQHAIQALRRSQFQAQLQLKQAQMKGDKSKIAQAQDSQRAVSQEAQSLSERVQQLSNQLENNAMTSPSELQRREEAQRTLGADAQQKMPAAADKMQQAQNANNAERNHSLAQANQQQNEVHNDLNKVQQLLSRTPTPDQLAQEATRLAQEQQQLADSSNSLAEDLRAQHQQSPHSPMSPEDKTGLQTEQQRQAQANEDTKQLQNQLQQAARDAKDRGDRQAADAMQKAADQLQKGDATGNQQQAQHSLNQNSPQNASPAQNKAAQALQKAADAAQKATGKSPSDPNQSPADRMEQAAQDLKKMAQQQRDLAAQAGQNPDSKKSGELAQQQRALQQQAQQAQQQLDGAQSAQQSLQQAQQSMSQSGKQLGQNQSQQAQKPAQDAAQQLENAARQAQNAAQQLRQEQKAQELQAQVERLAQLQRGLHDATQRLEKAKQDGSLTSNDMTERRQVAERQAGAEKEARDLSSQFPSPAFQQAMKMASQQMHPATHNLNQDEPNTSAQTQSAQDHASQTLDTIARALKQQAQNGSQSSQSGQSGQSGQSAQSAQQDEAAEALGELMLAQGLQQQLRQDTGALDQARGQSKKNDLTPEQQQQADQLSRGQNATRDITRRAGERLQDTPDAAQSAQEAQQQMGQAGQRLEQQQTGKETQGHQDQAMRALDQAVKQAQQAMQQQQQQQQAMQQSQQGAPQPMQQKGSEPNHQAFTRLVGAQRGAMSAPEIRQGRGFAALPPRTQRALREGMNERVPAEYQDLVNRYRSSVAEKQK